jgi:predicted nucleic acid-binding protein
VLSNDDEVCQDLRSRSRRLRQKGRTIGDFDLLIVATHELQICTRNRRHSEAVEGLSIISL